VIKRLTTWHARPGVSREHAVERWPGGHVDLVLAVPGVRHYVQNYCVPDPGGAEPPYAGLGEVWFGSTADAVAAQQSSQWQAVIEDAATFMDFDRLTVAWADEQRAS